MPQTHEHGRLDGPARPADLRAAPPSGTRSLSARLAGEGGPLLLDGATGTELERAGLSTGLPLWSTHALLEAPECVARIHAAYLEAGAEIVTANTFRTQRRTLARGGLGPSDAHLTRLAVDLARLALARHGVVRPSAGVRPGAVRPGADTRALPAAARPATSDPELPRWIAGSLPPLEDCYRPDLVPSDRELAAEHGRQAELLGEAGVDLILVETMNTTREARAAARAAARTGLPFVVGFVAWDGARLLSGESLAGAARAAREQGAAAVGVNCVPVANLRACRRALAGLGAPLLVSPNLGQPEPQSGFARDGSVDPRGFPAAFEPWLERPAVILGGCCGTTPAHIATLAARVRQQTEGESRH